jgi:hypothetical protein
MKHLKILGLAAIAALALTAITGAGTASASRLCKTTVAVCPDAWDWPAGTNLQFSLDSASVVFEVNGIIEDTCTTSTMAGNTMNTGSSTETVEIPLGTKTFTNCTNTTKVLARGALEIHADPNAQGQDVGAGTVTSKGTELTVVAFGFISCVLKTGAGLDIGTLDEPANANSDATLTVKATIQAFGAGCPPSVDLTGEYKVTSPTPLYVSTS